MTDIEIPPSFLGRPYAEAHFKHIAHWARENTPFYRHFHANPGIPPLLTREILQAYNDELLNGQPVTGRTSGATSVPVRVHWSRDRSRLEKADNLSFATWCGGVLPHAKIVALTAHQSVPNALEVASPVELQLAFVRQRIAEHGTRSLISYPTNLVHLSRHLLDSGQLVAELQRIVCMSELFEPSQEQLIQKAFPNARISATYSSTEVGMIAGRCPHNPDNYHLMAHKLGVEFLNADGNPCVDGEVGQLVITDYANQRMPLIRYAIGDLAAPVQCNCGKIPLPALTRLLGKSRGLLRHPNGGHVFSTELSPHIRDSSEIMQYQVVQLEPERFRIRAIAKQDADRSAFEQRMYTLFQQYFGADTALEFEWCTEIPRLPGGKYLEFVGMPESSA